MNTTNKPENIQSDKKLSSYLNQLITRYANHSVYKTNESKEDLLDSLNNLNEYILELTKNQ